MLFHLTFSVSAVTLRDLRIQQKLMLYFSTDFNLTAALIGLNAALVSAGCVVAGPFIGPIVDKWGRKKGLAFGAGISVLAVVLEASAATGKWSGL